MHYHLLLCPSCTPDRQALRAMRSVVGLLFVLQLLQPVVGYFSDDFRDWIDGHRMRPERLRLERSDLRASGSFGGREANNSGSLGHNPVVFVHGVSSVAGHEMRAAANYYREHGYNWAELYGTTYDNPAGDATKWIKYSMKCDHVKRVRSLLKAVHFYTHKPVDVVAFSMGVLIARKAILGGKCIENAKEDLGRPLTSMIDTFIGIAGPNKGAAPIVAGVPFGLCALFPMVPVCNNKNGLFSGYCPNKSEFIEDINKESKYEGRVVFTMGSTSDEIVGHKICGEVTTRIAGQKAEMMFKNKKHLEVFSKSYDTQIKMLQGDFQ